MDKTEEKAEKASYMREWTEKNKERLNKKRREKRASLSKEELEKEKERHRVVCRKSHDKNRDKVNARAKERNWNYSPEAGKAKREKFRDAHLGRNILKDRKAFAKKKDLLFDLTEDWYIDEWMKGCAVTGIPFDSAGSDTPWVAHTDRVIPEKGYTIENVRLVCACFNLAKKHWTDDDVITMAKALIRNK